MCCNKLVKLALSYSTHQFYLATFSLQDCLLLEVSRICQDRDRHACG